MSTGMSVTLNISAGCCDIIYDGVYIYVPAGISVALNECWLM